MPVFGRALSGLSCTVLAMVLVVGQSSASHLKENPKKHRIVYQLSDAGVDKAKFVLGNMRNHVKGVGAENIEALELVVFGPALKSFATPTIDPEVRAALEALQLQGAVFGACGNTMLKFNVRLDQLPEGAKYLPQGGVVRVMELQEQGYTVIRP